MHHFNVDIFDGCEGFFNLFVKKFSQPFLTIFLYMLDINLMLKLHNMRSLLLQVQFFHFTLGSLHLDSCIMNKRRFPQIVRHMIPRLFILLLIY